MAARGTRYAINRLGKDAEAMQTQESLREQGIRETEQYFVGYNVRLERWGVFQCTTGHCLEWHPTEAQAIQDARRRTKGL